MSTEEPSALAFTRVAIRHGDNTSPTVARALVEMYDRAKARADAADLRANAAEENARRANANVAANVKNAAQAEAKIAAVREVHALEHCNKWGRRSDTPQGLGGWCNSCGTFKGDACPTIAALDGTA